MQHHYHAKRNLGDEGRKRVKRLILHGAWTSSWARGDSTRDFAEWSCSFMHAGLGLLVLPLPVYLRSHGIRPRTMAMTCQSVLQLRNTAVERLNPPGWTDDAS